MTDWGSWSEEDVGDDVVKESVLSAAAGLRKRRSEIALPDDFTFIDTLCVDGRSDCHELDVNDDLSRELAFYEQALDAANVGLKKLKALKVPTRRPEDYFAEMVKTDKHMQSVRARLVKEKGRLDLIEQRKRDRELRMFGKSKQKEVANERRKEAADAVKDVKKWQKRRKAGLADDVELEDLLSKKQDPLRHKKKKPEDQGQEKPQHAPYQPTQQHRGRRKSGEKKMSKKQQYKQQKFGRGSGGRASKKNTRESSNDTRGFRNPSRQKRGGGGGGKRKR